MNLLWSLDKPWTDFRPLLLGEAAGAVSFLSANGTTYVVNATEGWYRRSPTGQSNLWDSDGKPRALLEIVLASSCCLRLRHDLGEGQFTTTTPIVAVVAGERSLSELNELRNAPRSVDVTAHPPTRCAAIRCLLVGVNGSGPTIEAPR